VFHELPYGSILACDAFAHPLYKKLACWLLKTDLQFFTGTGLIR